MLNSKIFGTKNFLNGETIDETMMNIKHPVCHMATMEVPSIYIIFTQKGSKQWWGYWDVVLGEKTVRL